jgi:F-type H+-transporting ATPase subunit epsilon
MGILPNHAPLISNLKPGIVELSSDSEAAKRYFVAEGFVEVSAERCTILATNALDVEGLSVADVDSMIAEQKALLEKSYNEEESLKVEKEIDFLTGLSSALSATA